MIVKDLNGKEYDWKPRGKTYLFNAYSSSPHNKVREMLKKIFPTQSILEEVSIKVTPRTTLYLDFYLPMLRRAIEVHGEQHFSYNTKFHKTRQDFLKQQRNDRMKKEWCELNGINLTVLSSKDEENWTSEL